MSDKKRKVGRPKQNVKKKQHNIGLRDDQHARLGATGDTSAIIRRLLDQHMKNNPLKEDETYIDVKKSPKLSRSPITNRKVNLHPRHIEYLKLCTNGSLLVRGLLDEYIKENS